MKRLMLCLVCLCLVLCLSTPIHAMDFFQDPDTGTLFVESNSCQDMYRLSQVFGDKTNEDVLPNGPSQAHAVLPTFHEQNFQYAQEKLIAFVRDMNWKTGLHLTLRDASFFQRLKMICSGVNTYTKPFRLQLSIHDPQADEHLAQLENAAIDALQEKVTDATFHKVAKLSIRGLHTAIITNKPFLLLLIDEDTYHQLVEIDPAIQDLADNLYKFFAYRAVYMDEEYNQNTKALIKVSKIGDGDAVQTWAIMATFAEKMYWLDQEHQLNPDQESHNHIWRLRATLSKIKRHVEIEKRAATLALEQNPSYRKWLNEQNNTNRKKPTLDQEAVMMLKSLTEKQIRDLIEKYKGK